MRDDDRPDGTRQRLSALLALLADPWFLVCVGVAAAIHVLVVAWALSVPPKAVPRQESRRSAASVRVQQQPLRRCTVRLSGPSQMAACLARQGALRPLGFRAGRRARGPGLSR